MLQQERLTKEDTAVKSGTVQCTALPHPPLYLFSRTIGGPESDVSSGFKGSFASVGYKLGGSENITVEVNNVLVNKEIHNVFGVIKGFIDPGTFLSSL